MNARSVVAVGILLIGELLTLLPLSGVTPIQSAIQSQETLTNLEVVIGWEATSRALYQVRSKITITDPWEALNQSPLIAEAGPMVFTNLAVDPQRFYQIVDLDFVWIEPGQFVMGSPRHELGRFGEEGPLVDVTLTRGYWISRYEVTQGEYLDLMGNNPSFVIGTRNYPSPNTQFGTNLLRPVELVSWLDAMSYCDRLTTLESAAGRVPPGFVYRLPTEAEWEFACRAGTTTPYSHGSVLKGGMANFDWRYEYYPTNYAVEVADAPWPMGTTAVGSFPPNPWGLYDMHGNVFEWCYDWWIPNYPETTAVDPVGPPSGTDHAMRGGCWNYPGYRLRSAQRRGHTPHFTSLNVGFRVVLGPVL